MVYIFKKNIISLSITWGSVCYPTLPLSHLQILDHIWGNTGLHVCKDNQLSFLSSCSTVLDIFHYGYGSLLLWSHIHYLCLPATGLWLVHAGEQKPWASFLFRFFRVSRKVLSYYNCGLHCLWPVNSLCL